MDDAAVTPPAGAARRQLADGRDDLLIREEPLLLVVHGRQLLTMRTPGRDEDLARGFLLGEGIVRQSADIVACTALAGDPERQKVDELHLTLRTPPTGVAAARLSRTHEIRSSCGVCGVVDPATMLDELPPLLPGVPKLPAALVATLLERLAQRQPLFAATGGNHGALIAGADGTVLGAGEDVGRHNALDKAIGEAARRGGDLTRAIAVLSGRAGYDLVIKCLRVRLPIVISVSAPSTLAFDLCRAAGATLLGFARDQRHVVYCGGERLTS
ncbi:MAG: formate dehydrogenase accessory sulfurtransferase FdhD [Planctomycetes bacterium]|nr:formate dehydrogenase accessory sulfurtransferase FdhD [Planctomycetota bacterium]